MNSHKIIHGVPRKQKRDPGIGWLWGSNGLAFGSDAESRSNPFGCREQTRVLAESADELYTHG